jgi:Flp pilus assembly protein TadG
MLKNVDRQVNRLFQITLIAGLFLILILIVEGVLAFSNHRIAQAALDEAARAAATAVDVVEVEGAPVLELRLDEVNGQPSAYTMAERVLGPAASRVALTEVVSDGNQVIVRAQVTSPTLLLQVLGFPNFTYPLLSSAELRADTVP